MIVVETSSGESCPVEIVHIELDELKKLSKDRYFFDWLTEREQEVYKLCIVGRTDILGLISLERIPSEWRVHIRLLTVSKENRGKETEYEHVAGNLLTHAAKIALFEFGEFACISLRPKSRIAKHYIVKYNMNITGMTLSLEVPEILDLINLYDHD